MTGDPGDGGGSERRRLAAVVGVIFLFGFAALGAAWWFLDEVLERQADAEVRKVERALETKFAPLLARPEHTATDFVVRLHRSRESSTTRVATEANELVDFTPAAVEALEAAATAWRERSAGAGDREKLRGVVEAGPAVPTTDVIRAVDALMAAGLTDVTFSGTPEPGSTLDRITGGGK